MLELKPWMPPLIVVAIVIPIVAGFVVAGPALGLALGALAVSALLFTAARSAPRETIETAAATDMKRRVLVVLSSSLEDPAAIEALRQSGEFDRPGNEAEVLVLAPAKAGALDRWATDDTQALAEAQRRLVVSVASLGKADVVARAMVGDANPVLAVEDTLRSFAATEVILVTGPPSDDPQGQRAAADLEERLAQPLSRIVVR